jgi:hypothetical protein
MFTAHDPTGEPFAFADSSKAARAACEDRGRGCYVALDGVVLSWVGSWRGVQPARDVALRLPEVWQ